MQCSTVQRGSLTLRRTTHRPHRFFAEPQGRLGLGFCAGNTITEQGYAQCEPKPLSNFPFGAKPLLLPPATRMLPLQGRNHASDRQLALLDRSTCCTACSLFCFLAHTYSILFSIFSEITYILLSDIIFSGISLLLCLSLPAMLWGYQLLAMLAVR